ncbi:MAG: hypothetical protein KG003_02645 [Bacteroidetes bacterium]|nr:hypothetical protein [Bacteroidota bacterium]
MKTFFAKTFLFWVTSKILLILITGLSTYSILSSGGLRTEELVVNLLVLLELVILVITITQDLTIKSNYNFLKIISGILLIVSAIAFFIVLLRISGRHRSDLYYWGYPFVLWIFLIGIFELLRVRRNNITFD